MKKLTVVPNGVWTLMLVALVGACRGGTAAPAGSTTGAGTPEGAVNAYLAAAKARDLQAMSAVWGTSRGSVRETMDRETMEKSETIVMALLCPDEHRVVSQVAGQGGRRNFRVEFKRGQRTIQVTMVTIAGPGGRWYVEDLPLPGDLPQQLQSFCR